MSAFLLLMAALWGSGSADVPPTYQVRIQVRNAAAADMPSVWLEPLSAVLQSVLPASEQRIILLRDELGEPLLWLDVRMRAGYDASPDANARSQPRIYPFLYEPF